MLVACIIEPRVRVSYIGDRLILYVIVLSIVIGDNQTFEEFSPALKDLRGGHSYSSSGTCVLPAHHPYVNQEPASRYLFCWEGSFPSRRVCSVLIAGYISQYICLAQFCAISKGQKAVFISRLMGPLLVCLRDPCYPCIEWSIASLSRS